MKILTWNCNGALREKFEAVKSFAVDIYVIQECEDPALSKHKAYKEWANNFEWSGDSKHKGLGIFAMNGIQLNRLDWSNVYEDRPVKFFLPCLINNSVQLIATWTHYNNSPTFGYVGQFWKYLQLHRDKLKNTILVGDFNSNVFWDRPKRWWNHSDVVKLLSEMGIESLYHKYHNEEQGKETLPTFFLQRNIGKPYHIDYCFASVELTRKKGSALVGNYKDWKHLSDHVPMLFELDDVSRLAKKLK